MNHYQCWFLPIGVGSVWYRPLGQFGVGANIKSDLGLPDLQVRYQPVKVSDQVSAVSQGKVDILCTPTPPTLERRKMISYSIPIYTAGLSVVVRKDASEPLLNVLSGKAANSGPTWRASINNGLANHTYATIEGGGPKTGFARGCACSG